MTTQTQTTGHRVDVSKGEVRGDVSAQWASRPADQRFLSLDDLHAKVLQWANESKEHDVMLGDIVVEATEDNQLKITVPDVGDVEPTHYAFGALCARTGTPSEYMRQLPAPLSAACLDYGLMHADNQDAKLYIRKNGSTVLRAATSPKYGRIFDHEVVDAVRKIAGNGTGDTRWKVPGVIDWSTSRYNPHVDITKDTTTLYASDRDVFVFLVDDLNPIEVGKLDNGDPDLLFRGFYSWNSEVGASTFGIAAMYLRGVCQNRNLWGVEGFTQRIIRHNRLAPERFAEEAIPALTMYAEGSTGKLIEGVREAKRITIGKDDEERVEFFTKFGLSISQAKRAIETCEREEGRKPTNLWEAAQGVTAMARSIQHQDKRVALEEIGMKMLDKVSV